MPIIKNKRSHLSRGKSYLNNLIGKAELISFTGDTDEQVMLWLLY